MDTCSRWLATHKITSGRRVWVVMLAEGAAYTRAEWDAYERADWECDPDGVWTFQGAAAPGVGAVFVRALRREEGASSGRRHLRRARPEGPSRVALPPGGWE